MIDDGAQPVVVCSPLSTKRVTTVDSSDLPWKQLAGQRACLFVWPHAYEKIQTRNEPNELQPDDEYGYAVTCCSGV